MSVQTNVQTNAALFAPLSEGQREEALPATVAAPAREELLPKTLSGLFDEAFDLYKRHFTTIALCVALIFLPALLCYHAADLWLRPLLLLASSGDSSASVWAGIQVFFGYAALYTMLLATLITASGPATVAVAELYQGRAISVREAFHRAAPYLFRLAMNGLVALLGAACIAAVMLFVGLFAFGLLAALMANEAFGPLLIIAALIIFVLVPYLAACLLIAGYFLLTPALTVLEKLPLSGLTERNNLLIRKPGWRRAWLAAIFLPLVTLGMHGLIYYAAQSLLGTLHLSPSFEYVAQSGVSALTWFLLQPYWIIFLTLLYFDCRVRREGLDVTQMTDAAHLLRPAAPLAGSPTLSTPLIVFNVPPAGSGGRPAPLQPNAPSYPGQQGVFYAPPTAAVPPAPETRQS